MADVAVISVVSSAVVGVLGACGGFYAQRVTLQNEDAKRLEARRNNIRDVLGAAATAAMSPDIPSASADNTMRDFARDLGMRLANMKPHRGQLGIQLGPASPVVVAYEELWDALWRAHYTYHLAPSELTFADLSDLLSSGDPPDATGHAIIDAEDDAQAAMTTFLAAANAVVGENALVAGGSPKNQPSLPSS